MSNKVYDVLKYICQIALPALLTATATILALLGVNAELIATITGIGTAVVTLMGTLLGISTAKYNAEMKKEEAENHEGL